MVHWLMNCEWQWHQTTVVRMWCVLMTYLHCIWFVSVKFNLLNSKFMTSANIVMFCLLLCEIYCSSNDRQTSPIGDTSKLSRNIGTICYSFLSISRCKCRMAVSNVSVRSLESMAASQKLTSFHWSWSHLTVIYCQWKWNLLSGYVCFLFI